MVHVSDGGGRHKMLAFSTEPNINIASVKDESNISSITETTSATTTVVVANGRGVKAINLINSTNLSIIAEEPQIIMSNNAAEESTLQVVFNNGNNDIDKDAANGNNNINATEGNNRDLTNNVNGNYQTVNSDAADEAKNMDKSKVVKRNNKINNGKHLATATTMKTHHSSPNAVRAAASNGATKRLRDSFEEKTVPQADVVLAASTPTKLKSDAMTNNINEKNTEEPATAVATTPVVMKTGKSANGNKSAGLKRVSFGSSKGSMVETLIFETPVSEDPGSLRTGNNDSQLSNLSNNKSSHHHHHHHHHRNSGDPNDPIESSLRGSTGGSRPPSRVRVTFFEQEKPLAVSSPESDIGDFDLSSMTLPGSPNAMDRTMSPAYNRHISAEAGWDNPFRPDGDLSKEADQIVELIKEGKPINDETLRSKSPSVNEAANTVTYNNALNATPGKGVNGSAANGGNLEVQRGVVAPAGATVEHVTLKKKKGCCVIQ